MKLAALLLSLSLVSCAVVPSSPNSQDSSGAARERSNRVSVYLGGRGFDADDLEPVEDQVVVGVEFSQEKPDWVVGWEAGFQGSAATDEVGGNDIDAAAAELYAGVRKTFGSALVRPYLGAGLSAIQVAVDGDAIDEDDDGSLGLYAHGGVLFQFTPLFSIGADVRGLFGTDIELYGVNGDADYWQFALVAGFAF